MAKKVKVTYDRERCIGAGSCAVVCPKYWKMMDDGKANLLGSKQNTKTKNYELKALVTGQDLKCLREAADSCPVQVIKVVEEK